MDAMTALFGSATIRFATAGSLITAYLIADRLAARPRARARAPSPKGVGVIIALSLTGFYALIGPAGGALWSGGGNVLGLVLAGTSVSVRVRRVVRYPNFAGRALLYLALPLATGVPWGLLVLSVPAWITSTWCCLHQERWTAPDPEAPRYRLVPGIW